MAPRQGEGCLSPWPCPVALARVSFCRTRLARQIRPLSCPPLQTRRSLPLSLARTRCDGLATESHSRPCGPQFSHWSSRRPPPPSSLPYLPLFPYPLPPSPSTTRSTSHRTMCRCTCCQRRPQVCQRLSGPSRGQQDMRVRAASRTCVCARPAGHACARSQQDMHVRAASSSSCCVCGHGSTGA